MHLPSPEKLQALGFIETGPTPTQSTPSRRNRFVRPRGARPKRARVSTPAAASTPFSPTRRAEQLIAGFASNEKESAALDEVLEALLEDLSEAADPMRALLNFARLCDAVPERVAFFVRLKNEAVTRARLCRVLGWSQALADTIVRYPQHFDKESRRLSRPQLRKLAEERGAEYSDTGDKLEALRRFRREQTLRIGLLDMECQSWRSVEDFRLVVRQISDLAQVCVQAALDIIAAEYSGTACGFAVIAMGKFGGRELNYSSDIDLIFLQDGEHLQADEIGAALLRVLNEAGSEGALHRVDMRLRPEGQNGPLVTPISYALNYYEAFAAAWEWQALIKTRGVAGDAKLARRFRRFTRAITWARRGDDAHLREIVAMKKRSESTPEGADENNVKQGPGSIRDAEWVVQQLQMMVGPQHPPARASGTLRAIERLHEFEALTFVEARDLRDGYLFLRVLEHRLQLLNERAVRTLPDDEAELAALARRMGTPRAATAAAHWLREEHAGHRREIRRLCEKLFWGWREAAEAGEIPHSALSTPHSARLQRLAEGTKAQPTPAPLARQIKAALPDALVQLEYSSDPERAMVNLERLCDASGNKLSLLRSLGGSPRLARAVFSILGGSQVLSDTLIRFPQLLDMAGQRAMLEQAKDAETARLECRAYCYTFRDRAAALRRWRAREFLRIGLRDLVMDVSPHAITREIAALAQACLSLACDETGAALRPGSEQLRFAVIGMGKLGGGEMHYSSDADVLFVYDTYQSFEGASVLAAQWAEKLMAFMNERTEDGLVFEVDARLRPHGRSGPLAPSVAAYIEYFENPITGLAVWERQALTRARMIAGNPEPAGYLLAAAHHVAFPEVWQPQWGDELRHIKHRVETERGAASAKGKILDVKLGRGGLSDIEWCAQWLAMKYGAHVPWLQTTNTLSQIEAARAGGVLPDAPAQALMEAYTFLRRAELRLQVTQSGAITAVEVGGKKFEAWARAVFPDETTEAAMSRFETEWQRHTEAAREILERVRDAL